ATCEVETLLSTLTACPCAESTPLVAAARFDAEAAVRSPEGESCASTHESSLVARAPFTIEGGANAKTYTLAVFPTSAARKLIDARTLPPTPPSSAALATIGNTGSLSEGG